MKPWLLLDVDGVLNPTLSDRAARRAGFTVRHTRGPDGWRHRVFLHPAHGEWLAAMTDVVDVAWATTWGPIADREFGPFLGLPNLPVVDLDLPRNTIKTPGILRFTAGRPFIWLDDAVTDRDLDLLAATATPHLVIAVDHRTGLTMEHLGQAQDWAENGGREAA